MAPANVTNGTPFIAHTFSARMEKTKQVVEEVKSVALHGTAHEVLETGFRGGAHILGAPTGVVGAALFGLGALAGRSINLAISTAVKAYKGLIRSGTELYQKLVEKKIQWRASRTQQGAEKVLADFERKVNSRQNDLHNTEKKITALQKTISDLDSKINNAHGDTKERDIQSLKNQKSTAEKQLETYKIELDTRAELVPVAKTERDQAKIAATAAKEAAALQISTIKHEHALKRQQSLNNEDSNLNKKIESVQEKLGQTKEGSPQQRGLLKQLAELQTQKEKIRIKYEASQTDEQRQAAMDEKRRGAINAEFDQKIADVEAKKAQKLADLEAQEEARKRRAIDAEFDQKIADVEAKKAQKLADLNLIYLREKRNKHFPADVAAQVVVTEQKPVVTAADQTPDLIYLREKRNKHFPADVAAQVVVTEQKPVVTAADQTPDLIDLSEKRQEPLTPNLNTLRQQRQDYYEANNVMHQKEGQLWKELPYSTKNHNYTKHKSVTPK